MKKTLVLAAVILSGALAGNAQLVTYTFEGDVNTPATVDGDVSATALSLNTGTISYSAGAGGGRAIVGTSWQGDPGDKYWEFTVTPQAGLALELFSLSFDYRSTGTGPSNWAITINGQAAGSGSMLRDSTFHPAELDLSGFSGLSSAQVRLTGYGGTSSSGTWRLDNVVLDGMTLTVVPEPSTWALLGGGLAFLAYRLRRRK